MPPRVQEGRVSRLPKAEAKRSAAVRADLAVLDGGRTMPHNVDAEQCLLACIMVDAPDVLARCHEKHLSEDSFFIPAHQLIYRALAALNERTGLAVDLVALAEELSRSGTLDDIGGVVYLNEIANRIETTAHIGHYIEIVQEKYLLRSLIRMATDTVEKCFEHREESGLDHFLDEVEQELFRLSETRVSETARHVSSAVDDAVQLIHKLLERKGELSGLATGFTDLDKLTFGFHPQEMIVLAARPSMGKTSLALNMAEAVALPKPGRQAHGVLIFSLEMSREQLALRLLCSRARVSAVRLRESFANRDDQARLVEAAKELKAAPIHIDDSGHLTILELRAKARRLNARHRLGMIIVDYLQLISGTDARVQREQQIAEISRGLKALAKDLHVPVLVLSQLNRESEKERRQPRLSDLRESGSIEQDADVVLLLAKPKDSTDETSVASDRAELIIAKQRNGPVGDVKLTFLKEITRFENSTE
ncbi:MAG: replicative DNA helicase [Puniceicoccaceae bacterium]|nr:MAG: replicative DNA helicase [Puniceicoccaceae bacterium]